MTAPNPQAPPTPDQLLNLVARAEHKGGLTSAEAARLRQGLRLLSHPSNNDGDDEIAELRRMYNADIADLRRRYDNARKNVWRWKNRATAADTTTTEPPVDDEARAALHRVTALVQRWTHIPAKRAAAAAVLATIQNRDDDD